MPSSRARGTLVPATSGSAAEVLRERVQVDTAIVHHLLLCSSTARPCAATALAVVSNGEARGNPRGAPPSGRRWRSPAVRLVLASRCRLSAEVDIQPVAPGSPLQVVRPHY